MDSKEGTQISDLVLLSAQILQARNQAGLSGHSALNFKVQRKAGAQNDFQ